MIRIKKLKEKQKQRLCHHPMKRNEIIMRPMKERQLILIYRDDGRDFARRKTERICE